MLAEGVEDRRDEPLFLRCRLCAVLDHFLLLLLVNRVASDVAGSKRVDYADVDAGFATTRADEKVGPFAEVIANSHCCDRSSSLSEDAGYGILDQFMTLGENRTRKFAADEVMERLATSYLCLADADDVVTGRGSEAEVQSVDEGLRAQSEDLRRGEDGHDQR